MPIPVLPHKFPSLRRATNENHRPSLLAIGAGLSRGTAPGPDKLLRDKRDGAEQLLAYASPFPRNPSPEARELYEWADDVIKALEARHEQNLKLALAEALGIPADPGWCVDAITSHNAARHRVIARFSREWLWAQIWSLNWDCAQESAKRVVGYETMIRGAVYGERNDNGIVCSSGTESRVE